MIQSGNLLYMEMFRKLSSQIITDLRELEGDYRVFNLQIDKAQSVLSMIIACVGIFGMFWVDWLIFSASPGLAWWMALCRGGYIIGTLLTILVLTKTNKVRIFDRLIFAWLALTVLYMLLFDFFRPLGYQSAVFDIITVFSIYVLSPLKLRSNIILVMVFSVGTLLINYFLKAGLDPIVLNTSTAALVIVHVLGWGSALQMQSYRRKSFKAYIDEKDAKEMVAYLANIDPLTKSLTRRHFFSIAESEFMRFFRYRRALSVLVIDADSFKEINDSYGHHAGDIVLRSLSLVAMEQKRAQDTFGRLGGEEFGLILPETGLEQAKIVADRIQSVWAQTPSNLDGVLIHSTVSVGVAEARAEDKTFDDILRRADLMMYKAKEQGRNQVVSE
ncbi:MAG: GGDEF domain-containing protein [Chloroflexota bacterium]